MTYDVPHTFLRTFLLLQCGAYLIIVQLGIAVGRARIAMPKHALHDIFVVALFDQCTPASMAQLMQGRARCAIGVRQSGRRTQRAPLIMERIAANAQAAHGWAEPPVS